MSRTWFARHLAGVLLAGLLSVALAGPVRADHETITIDGDLTDLIAAVNNNLGSSQGGFTAASAVGDVCTVGCCFVNGFDARNYYLFLDFKEPGGGITPNVKLFAGWDVAGKIGDTDGDGDPNTFNPFLHPGCAISDPSGTVSIGQGESYTIEVDMNCDGAADVSFSVNGDAGGVTKVWRMQPFPPADITAQSHFAVVNGFLELEIDDFRQLIEDAVPGADLCHARITMTANSANDGLGEDRSSKFSLDVPHSVKITKLPAKQTACPSGPLSWTIELTNDGLCKLESMAVTDVLDAGMTYDSDDQGSTGDAHTRNWTFTNLASGGTQSITLNAHTDAVWVAPVLNNNVSVIGTHTPAPQCGDPEDVNTSASAIVNSLQNVDASALKDLTSCPGTKAQFCTTASGTGPFTYVWTKDGAPLAETSSCLTIAAATAGDAGEYCVTVTGACGTPVPRCATLTVSENVDATALKDLTRCPGTEAQFCTTASGTGPFTYAWTKDGSPLSETSNCLTIASPTAGDAGQYCVTVTGACGTPAQRCATLTVSENVDATALKDLTRCPGTEAQFCTTASGTGPFTYAWTRNGSPLSETSNCLTIASPTAGDAGQYCVTVTGACGTPAQRCATLTVSEPVAATVLNDLTRCTGVQAQFCTTASGTGPFTYAWTKDGSPLSETSNCLTIASPVEGDAGLYCVTVSGPCGTPVQRCATLTVRSPVAATTLNNLTLCGGIQAQFCTTASGTGPFTYAWTRNGSPLSETTNCLTIASVVAGDAGTYCVTVSGPCGTPVQRCATLVVNPPVSATTLNDVSQCPGPGTQAQFCTTASGTGPFTYAWTKDNVPIPGSSNCLTISPVTAQDAGTYCVTVSGGCGPPVTRCATLSTDCAQQVCWLTAGGARIREPGVNGQPLHSWGGVVYPGCSPSAADGGNWNHIAHAQNLHFQGTHLEVVDCGNVPGIPPGSSSPETPNNFIEFRGTGNLVGTGLNRVNYPLVYFFARCEDRSEPGSKGQQNPLFKDRYYLHVYSNQADPVGSTLLLVNQTTDPTNIQPVPITDGNMQIHFSGCEVVAVRHARPLNLQGDESVEPAADDLLPPGVPSPNPFRESTRIAYAVAAQAANVEVSIFDIAGRRVRSLVSDRLEPGHYTVTWDGRDDQGASLAYGMYFVRTMVSGQAQITRRVLFLH